MGKGQSKNCAGETGYTHAKKMNLDPYLTTYTEINSVNQRCKCKSYNYKIKWKHRKKTSNEIAKDLIVSDFLDVTPKA